MANFWTYGLNYWETVEGMGTQGFIYTPLGGVHPLLYEHTPLAMTPKGRTPRGHSLTE